MICPGRVSSEKFDQERVAPSYTRVTQYVLYWGLAPHVMVKRSIVLCNSKQCYINLRVYSFTVTMPRIFVESLEHLLLNLPNCLDTRFSSSSATVTMIQDLTSFPKNNTSKYINSLPPQIMARLALNSMIYKLFNATRSIGLYPWSGQHSQGPDHTTAFNHSMDLIQILYS